MFVSEERLIVDKIKDFIKKSKNPFTYYHVVLRDGRIIDIRDYFGMVSDGKINPQDAYVYIGTGRTQYKATFYYPFLKGDGALLLAYLSKLGLYNWPLVVPATGLKYIAGVELYVDYLSIELFNLDKAVNNTNLPKIVAEVIGDKLISGEEELIDEEKAKIYNVFVSQRLFAGHTPDKAWVIIGDYYNEGNKSLAKEVARITMDYDRIFNPYTVCYDIKIWKEIDCLSIR